MLIEINTEKTIDFNNDDFVDLLNKMTTNQKKLLSEVVSDFNK